MGNLPTEGSNNVINIQYIKISFSNYNYFDL